MRNNPLPQDFATNLMPKGSDGKFLLSVDNLQMYIEAVLQYLQSSQQNLNIPDFVDTLIQSLDLDLNSVSVSDVLTSALRHTLTCKHYQISGTEGLLQAAIKDWLMAQGSNYITRSRYRAILTADFPMVSTINHKKIAVWRNTSKMGDWGKRQAVSVRKWVKSTFTDFTDVQIEDLSRHIDGILKPLVELDVRHHNSYDFEGWECAYSSNKIRSCMNTDSDSEVGYKHTFTCYCSGYHGLPDNGLNLTVLYQDDTPVARAITFTYNEQNYYVRSYGDDRLYKWLGDNGYEQSDFKEDTILYTTEQLLKPYIDGDFYMAEHCTTSGGKHYWVLADDGKFDLRTTAAYASRPTQCECCGHDYYADVDTQEVLSHVDREYYIVCDSCLGDNYYYVYTGGDYAESLFFHDGYSPDTNSGYVEYDGDYYETESLREYNLHLIGGEVYPEGDLYYCNFADEWYADEAYVYTSADEISTTQPVFFPYECISKEYWDENVVTCACGTLALSDDTSEISTPVLGSVITLYDYWTIYDRRVSAGISLAGIIFNLEDIERDYDRDPSEEMQAFRDYAVAYNTLQFLRFQELGI